MLFGGGEREGGFLALESERAMLEAHAAAEAAGTALKEGGQEGIPGVVRIHARLLAEAPHGKHPNRARPLVRNGVRNLKQKAEIPIEYGAATYVHFLA